MFIYFLYHVSDSLRVRTALLFSPVHSAMTLLFQECGSNDFLWLLQPCLTLGTSLRSACYLPPTSTFSHCLPFIIRMHLLIRDFRDYVKKINRPEFCSWDMKDRLRKTSVSVGRHCQWQNILWVHGLPTFVTLLTPSAAGKPPNFLPEAQSTDISVPAHLSDFSGVAVCSV